MKVLGLASYPVEAAATRYRLQQFVQPLADRGIELTIRPFLNSALFAQFYRKEAMVSTVLGLLKSSLMRMSDVVAANSADVIMIQREAMLLGPPLVEWMITRALKRPVVLDLDDATYVSYTSPTYGRISKTLKWFSKTDDLIRWARVVTCGNRAIAEYVSNKGAKARVIPTVVDAEIFRPAETRSRHEPVLGWIGTHSTFPYLESIFPVLQDLARSYDFQVKIVGSGKTEMGIPGVKVDNLPWNLEREVADFQSIDIGLYPIDAALYSGNWAAGKSGFKALQYMAVGIPYVATPVGASAEIGIEGTTHFCARTNEEWHKSLSMLLSDPIMRAQMGAAGRAHVIEHYGLPAQADKLAAVLREALVN
jgi:glycosyltransferase involved in cell wall biosynthesis